MLRKISCWVQRGLFCALGTLPAIATPAEYTIAAARFAAPDLDIFISDLEGRDAAVLAPDPAPDYNASFSPDGQWVVFTSERGGNADIYRIRRDGRGLERLVRDRAFDDQGAMSPDGGSLAFVSSRSGQADIWILNLKSGRARNITHAPSGEFRPAWSPDGQWIAFSSDRDPPRTTCQGSGASTGPGAFVIPQFTGVYVVKPDGSGLRRVSTTEEVAGSPSWSADGKRLMFHSASPDQVCTGGLTFATGESQIVAVEFSSGDRESLTTGASAKFAPRAVGDSRIAYLTPGGLAFVGETRGLEGDFGRPSWNAADRTMVFHRDPVRRNPLVAEIRPTVSLDRRFSMLAVPGHAAFSPDGRRVAILRSIVAAGGVANGTLTLSDSDGGNQSRVFESSPKDNLTGPAWSPRGDVIAFSTGAFLRNAGMGPARIVTIRSDGTSPTPLYPGERNEGMPSWSPDARQIVYRMADGAARGIYILDVDTGQRRRLETGSDRDTFPHWSPRGDWITFTSQRDGDYEIYRIRPDGSGLRRLTRLAGHDAHSTVSPDGAWVAFATSHQGFKDEAIGMIVGERPPPFQAYGEIAVMRIDGSDLRLLTDNSVEEGVPVWMPRNQ